MPRAMKDSRIEWIGEIPNDWEVKKLKYLGDLCSNGVDKKIRDGEALCQSVHYMDVYRNSLQDINKKDDFLVISATEEKANRCTLEIGDVLFTNSSETQEDMGHSVVIGEEFKNILFGYHLIRFRSNDEMYLKFKKYLFGSYYMRKWFEYRSVGITRYGISYKDFADTLIIKPPIEDQRAIAGLLDNKCKLIDSTIEKQKLVIKKLKQYKQSVIIEAITKGLDPTVKMKPSGIEWIGEIPEKWSKTKLKILSDAIGDGLHGTPNYSTEGSYFFINGNNLGEKYITIKSDINILDDEEYEKYKVALDENTLLISLNGTIGNLSFYNKEPIVLSKSAGYIRLKPDVNKNYIYWYLQSGAIKRYFELSFAGTTINNLSLATLRNTPVLLPSVNVQHEIADYLNCKCDQINSVIEKKSKCIDKLNDYKKSLIYECVTGKREVV